jgi:transcriptional antiterminator NusG
VATDSSNNPIEGALPEGQAAPDVVESALAEESAGVPVSPEGDGATAGEPEQPVEAEAPEEDTVKVVGMSTKPKPTSPAKRTRKEKKPVRPESTEPKSESMDWYILKVQSNREESIREGLLRRVAIAGFDKFFGDVIVPVERVTEFKGGKKRVIKRKLYPGYLVVHMEINEETWFLVRETPGIGDFTGAAGLPTPMLPHEVSRILAGSDEKPDEAPKLKISFSPSDRVKIKEGTFENFEGEVESIDNTNGRVTVMINIFGRSTPVELEYWQIEAV